MEFDDFLLRECRHCVLLPLYSGVVNPEGYRPPPGYLNSAIPGTGEWLRLIEGSDSTDYRLSIIDDPVSRFDSDPRELRLLGLVPS